MAEGQKQGAPKYGTIGSEAAGEVVDWGNSDGFSLWDAAVDAENGLEGWEGRQETHDMFHNSYD
ncbi:hypothetical protein [Paenibacillus tengchongensis]|uniref:hypothetical protein n=1 Tax=Paenibacillus tengchongensis TaxID=2608684 RepID=UPI00124C8838|nr:hypothetical protein [Paenibacillus tengchongensis]